MEGGKEMIPQTTHLTHFYANTAAGSASDVSPDTLLHKYCGRWAGNVASDRPPDTLFNEYRGRWCIKCIT